MSRMRDGTRKITHVVELTGMEEDIVTLQDVFRFRVLGLDERGAIASTIDPTGLRPRIMDRLFDRVLDIPAEISELYPDTRQQAYK
jgi:pilus assembly protein CpaF